MASNAAVIEECLLYPMGGHPLANPHPSTVTAHEFVDAISCQSVPPMVKVQGKIPFPQVSRASAEGKGAAVKAATSRG